jgi:hypothetical protein
MLQIDIDKKLISENFYPQTRKIYAMLKLSELTLF